MIKNYVQQHKYQLLLVGLAIACMAMGWHEAASGIGIGVMVLDTTQAPFPVTPQLTAIAIAYRNEDMIADAVLPRVSVGSKNFKYMLYPKGMFFANLDTAIARKGIPQEVEFTGTETTSSTVDQGLDDVIPQEDVDLAAAQGLPDPEGVAVEGIQELLALRREYRAAALVFAAGTYDAACKVTLAGNDQWSAFTQSASDPIEDIEAGKDALIMRPNVMVLGQAVASKLRRHPVILKAYNGTLGDTGMVPTQFLADLFEMEEVLIGKAWVNTAAKNQAPVMARVWGKHCALIHRNRKATPLNGTTFGFTGQWGSRIGGSIAEPKVGLKGGRRVRSGESVKELVTASDLGYFIQNAVA